MLTTNTSYMAVQASLKALIQNYQAANAEAISKELGTLLQNESVGFLERSKQLDQWLGQHPEYAELSDVLFDLMMVQFLSAELHAEDFFDSPEWDEIENKTLDKGSEMLNLYLYLSEAKETEVDITLEDFLNEFLLVGEDEFQDEYRIYESLIVNEDILDADLAGIRQIKETIKTETGIQDYFVSLVLFFQFTEDGIELSELNNMISPFEAAILHAMIAFNEN